MKRIDPRLTANARALRNGATPAERAIWRILSRYRPRFTRQLVVGPFIADLACRKARLVVELDGGHHAADLVRDRERTRWLEAHGWRVMRYWNSDVTDNPDGVAEAILIAAAECLGGTHPQPLPFREGRVRSMAARLLHE